MKEDIVFIKHIRDSILRVERFMGGMNFEKFKTEELVQSGVIRQLEIIGEASKNISTKFKNSHPEIEWKEMAGMRDKLIHFYFGVNLKTAFSTVKENIPVLKEQIESILKNEEGQK